MRSALLVITAMYVTGTSLSHGAGNDDTKSLEPLQLEVRVHLLTSDTVQAVNCTLGDAEVRELFAGVNKIWQQAGVLWQLESIVHASANPEMQDRFAALVHESKQGPRNLDRAEIREVVRNIYPTGDRLAGGWNVYVVEDLGRTIGGAYHVESQSLLFGKHGPKGRQTAIVLAHEFGHSLGLPHVADTFPDNLMMTASPQRSPQTSTVLVADQIEAARRQAVRGKPHAVSQRVRGLFELNDADRDGAVTREETRPVFLHNFAVYDANEDGRVELLEFLNAFDKTVMPAGRQPNRPAAAEARSDSPVPLGNSAGQRRPRGSVFDQYDENSDGQLSKQEVGQNWRRLTEFDANKDGVVDREEYTKAVAKATERMRERRRGEFAKADTDSDGALSAAESEAVARPILPPPLFERSDRNGDGALDKTEFEEALGRIRVSLLPPKRAAGRRAPGQRPAQRAHPDFEPVVERPAFAEGDGPLVLLDEAHFNYHTVEGRYAPFVKLLRRDGYVVSANTKSFSAAALQDARVLVIANALAEQNQRSWQLPTPSAFTAEEINAVEEWVADGGSLLLIADHMPFAGAAQELGAAFGVRFLNGFALDAKRFDRKTGQLCDHAVTRGRDKAERIDSVYTFTGSAFEVSDGFRPILRFGPGVDSLQPETAWRFSDETPRVNVEGWCQGAVAQYGEGRLAVFGEAAMFTAQQSGQGRWIGMNAPEAKQNGLLLLNTLHWLTGVLDVQ